jgi:glycine cleavage system H protein
MDYNIPDNLLYTEQHEWVMIEDNIATVGITDFAQKELGDIVYIDIPELGQKIEYMQICGSIESVKSVSDLYSPVDGIVIEFNEEVVKSPELLNQDPYKHWIFKAELKNIDKIKPKLLTAEKYKELIGK